MNILICDDEKEVTEQLKQYIFLFMNERNMLYNLYVFTDGEKAKNFGEHIDIALLDIEIGSVNGIDIAKNVLSMNRNAFVFFITAYNKYLDDAMNLNIHRFLNKPVDAERLYNGLEKAIEMLDETQIQFYLENNDSTDTICADDIIMVEIMGRGTKITTADEVIVSKEKMSFWKEKLIKSYFYPIHGSYIINLKYVTRYTRDEVELDGKYTIPVSYRRQAAFRRYWFSFLESR